ncbi:hypothetical protein DPX16_9562 [Anabarilius grahami]|uniref:Uncharacterized protein n=1 Tax=Anabarilius grahami TaxID=495550 RepID=A0A3N0Z6E8_ANAGA|nr:hypothetical protein DPX16_9562 [Anabarilius grahami]
MDQTRPRAGLETRCPAFGVYASCPKLFLGRLVGPYAFVYGSCPCRQNQRQMKTGPYQQYISMSHNDPFQELVDAMRRVLTSQPLSSSFTTAAASTSTASTPSPVFAASPMAKPAPYSGSAEDCSGFLLQCDLVLEMQPTRQKLRSSSLNCKVRPSNGRIHSGPRKDQS